MNEWSGALWSFSVLLNMYWIPEIVQWSEWDEGAGGGDSVHGEREGGEREIKREEKRGAPSPQAPAFAGKAESFRIREQEEDKLEQTSSFYLLFYTPDKNPGDNLILSNLISKEPSDAPPLPFAPSVAHKAPPEPPASAEARACPLPDSPAARANPPGLGEERREQSPPPPLRPLSVDTSMPPSEHPECPLSNILSALDTVPLPTSVFPPQEAGTARQTLGRSTPLDFKVSVSLCVWV